MGACAFAGARGNSCVRAWPCRWLVDSLDAVLFPFSFCFLTCRCACACVAFVFPLSVFRRALGSSGCGCGWGGGSLTNEREQNDNAKGRRRGKQRREKRKDRSGESRWRVIPAALSFPPLPLLPLSFSFLSLFIKEASEGDS